MKKPPPQKDFESASRRVIARFLFNVLAPIVRICMQLGLSAREFDDVVRWVFVVVYYNSPRLWRFGRPTAVQGAIKTGLPRQEVVRLSRIAEPQQALFTRRQNLAYRVIEGWVSDPLFHADGRPMPLPVRRTRGPTFAKLVMKYGNDVTMGAVLNDLKEVGCVTVEDGVVTLVNQTYGINFLNEDLLVVAGYMMCRYGHAITHNLSHPEIDDRWPQRIWWHATVPVERAPEAMAFLKEQIISWGREMDKELAERFAHAKPQEGVNYKEVGFGVFAFDDDANEESLGVQDDLIKRSNLK